METTTTPKDPWGIEANLQYPLAKDLKAKVLEAGMAFWDAVLNYGQCDMDYLHALLEKNVSDGEKDEEDGEKDEEDLLRAFKSVTGNGLLKHLGISPKAFVDFASLDDRAWRTFARLAWGMATLCRRSNEKRGLAARLDTVAGLHPATVAGQFKDIGLDPSVFLPALDAVNTYCGVSLGSDNALACILQMLLLYLLAAKEFGGGLEQALANKGYVVIFQGARAYKHDDEPVAIPKESAAFLVSIGLAHEGNGTFSAPGHSKSVIVIEDWRCTNVPHVRSALDHGELVEDMMAVTPAPLAPVLHFTSLPSPPRARARPPPHHRDSLPFPSPQTRPFHVLHEARGKRGKRAAEEAAGEPSAKRAKTGVNVHVTDVKADDVDAELQKAPFREPKVVAAMEASPLPEEEGGNRDAVRLARRLVDVDSNPTVVMATGCDVKSMVLALAHALPLVGNTDVTIVCGHEPYHFAPDKNPRFVRKVFREAVTGPAGRALPAENRAPMPYTRDWAGCLAWLEKQLRDGVEVRCKLQGPAHAFELELVLMLGRVCGKTDLPVPLLDTGGVDGKKMYEQVFKDFPEADRWVVDGLLKIIFAAGFNGDSIPKAVRDAARKSGDDAEAAAKEGVLWVRKLLLRLIHGERNALFVGNAISHAPDQPHWPGSANRVPVDGPKLPRPLRVMEEAADRVARASQMDFICSILGRVLPPHAEKKAPGTARRITAADSSTAQLEILREVCGAPSSLEHASQSVPAADTPDHQALIAVISDKTPSSLFMDPNNFPVLAHLLRDVVEELAVTMGTNAKGAVDLLCEDLVRVLPSAGSTFETKGPAVLLKTFADANGAVKTREDLEESLTTKMEKETTDAYQNAMLRCFAYPRVINALAREVGLPEDYDAYEAVPVRVAFKRPHIVFDTSGADPPEAMLLRAKALPDRTLLDMHDRLAKKLLERMCAPPSLSLLFSLPTPLRQHRFPRRSPV